MNEKLVAELIQVRAAKKQIETREKQIVAELGKTVAKENLELGHYPVGKFRVDLQRNARFDDKVAQTALTAAQRKKVTVPKIDGSLIKEHYGEALYRKCQKEYAPKIVVSIGE